MKKILFLVALVLALSLGPVQAAGKLPVVYNITLTSADTEYSQFIADVKAIEFQCRTAFAVRFAFETGKVATPTAPYMTLKPNFAYWTDVSAMNTTNIYLSSSEAGVVVEILVYK